MTDCDKMAAKRASFSNCSVSQPKVQRWSNLYELCIEYRLVYCDWPLKAAVVIGSDSTFKSAGYALNAVQRLQREMTVSVSNECGT